MMYRTLILRSLSRFCRDEDGAVTTDWVLLTALVIGLALATFNVVTGGTQDLSNDIASTASDFEIQTNF